MSNQCKHSQVVNAMSVDVEDYFQVSAFESQFERSDWQAIPCRVEQNVDRILQLFDEKKVSATFFTLGWVAERFPAMTRRIVDNGHELASHGWQHVRVTQQTPEEFREDIVKTKQLLEDLSGQPITGYRAASYSISRQNLWAHDELADAGYLYSSSIVPIKHDLYGIPDAPRFHYRTANQRLLEIPVTTLNLAGRNINCGGGGWFRLYPYRFSRWALKKVNQQESESAVFYFHPWEVDAEQPRVSQASLKSKIRHYINLSKMHGRLERLLDDFNWGRMDEVFPVFRDSEG